MNVMQIFLIATSLGNPLKLQEVLSDILYLMSESNNNKIREEFQNLELICLRPPKYTNPLARLQLLIERSV